MGIELNKDEKRLLLKIARDSIAEFLLNRETKKYDEISLPPALLQKAGAFVTIHKHRELRGCIGRFSKEESLYILVQKVGVLSATRDARFKPVTLEELPLVDFEISVLSPLQRIDSSDEFDPDKHGIYLKKNGRNGTFLPQVARQTRWTKEELLGHCARDKAGLNWDDWKNAELYIYTAQVFGE